MKTLADEIEKMKAELDKRNEATKVWIQSDTQCRNYCGRLEKQNEELARRLNRAIEFLKILHESFGQTHFEDAVELAKELEKPLGDG